MQLSISGHHVDLTDSLNNYIEQKFEKLDRHSDQITQVHVVLNVEKLQHLAEVRGEVRAAPPLAGRDPQIVLAHEGEVLGGEGGVSKVAGHGRDPFRMNAMR